MDIMQKLQERFLLLQKSDGIMDTELDEIQKVLNVELPMDFRNIATFFSGGYLGGISNFTFSMVDGDFNLITQTMEFRKTVKLLNRFIVLAEPPESIIVMDTENSPSIIWCDAVEVDKLGRNEFIAQPDEWESYLDYFTQLVEDEEDEM